MIDEFNIRKLGFDFMAYSLQKGDIYTFHHLIVPARKGGAVAKWNGAVLCGKTSHEYLHRIEAINYDIFSHITSEMIDINIKGYIDPQNLHYIDDALKYFEHHYCGLTTKKGKPLIKEQYTKRLKKY